MSKKDETCSKCGDAKPALATDGTNKRYCKCGHVWVPGLENLKRPDVVLKQAQEENLKLKAEVEKLRKENSRLTKDNNDLKALFEDTKASDEIFD